MWLLSFKALHIIGIVVWFAGLFYIGRLFVYHREVETRPEVEQIILKAQFELMERRLWYAITWPGMVVSLGMGLGLLYWHGLPSWIHAKLALVALLVVYHFQCGLLRKKLLEGSCQWSGRQLRMFNELPSLLLIMIVFVVVLKNALSWPIFLLSMVGVILVMGGSFQIYAKIRKRNEKKHLN